MRSIKPFLSLFICLQLLAISACGDKESEADLMEISSLEPPALYCGESLSIKGANFSSRLSEMKVLLQGKTLKILDLTTTRILVEVPDAVSSGPITVQRGNQEVQSSQDLTILVADPPVITAVSPNEGFLGEEIEIIGENFGDDLANVSVNFYGTIGEVVAVNSTSIRVKVPLKFNSEGELTVRVKGQSITTENNFKINTSRGSWHIPGWDIRYHDNHPIESEHFMVYSDGASQEMRRTISEEAETALADIKTIIDYQDGDFDFRPEWATVWGANKMHIMADYNQAAASGLAYRDGCIIRSRDSPRYDGDLDRWWKVFQHEITHITEFLMIGDYSRRQSNTVWMREGFANYGARNHRIQTIKELDDWQQLMTNVPGEGNPIQIKVWGDFPQEIRDSFRTIEYYGFFELVVRYLLEDDELGNDIQDMKNYYDDLGAGVPQPEAFLNHFGVAMDDLEANFWTIMREFLQN
ncbi:IPT/TIG domain-containing protein [Roseivirga sp. E12]|uniref:IPT/TIG domain-containing protein n=1 Tax=Roseivirga sp. E12 TaxID=2819237 RepID=UPI001ABCE1CB|nr:IPT/TIG domain-containing protein [Roseivirga sp. E12]MBO3696968.1 IPT/TIG domain-containing protein [Roseivirga sp. E12]